jgi:hypothetical protein
VRIPASYKTSGKADPKKSGPEVVEGYKISAAPNKTDSMPCHAVVSVPVAIEKT